MVTRNLSENPSPNPPPSSPSSPPASSLTVTSAITTAITTQVTATIPIVTTTAVQQGNVTVIQTQTQHVVTKIESVSQSVVTTVKVVGVTPTPQVSPSTDPQGGNDGDFTGSGSLNIQYNFSLIIFITLFSYLKI